MSHLITRAAAAEATVAQLDGKAFEWGRCDCVRMAALHVRRLGHRVALMKAGEYRNELGAVRALKRAGFDRLEDALDARFQRIPPAFALVGDLIGLPSDGDWPALTVQLSHGRVFGFMEGRAGVMHPKAFVAAWRVPVEAPKCRK